MNSLFRKTSIELAGVSGRPLNLWLDSPNTGATDVYTVEVFSSGNIAFTNAQGDLTASTFVLRPRGLVTGTLLVPNRAGLFLRQLTPQTGNARLHFVVRRADDPGNSNPIPVPGGVEVRLEGALPALWRLFLLNISDPAVLIALAAASLPIWAESRRRAEDERNREAAKISGIIESAFANDDALTKAEAITNAEAQSDREDWDVVFRDEIYRKAESLKNDDKYWWRVVASMSEQTEQHDVERFRKEFARISPFLATSKSKVGNKLKSIGRAISTADQIPSTIPDGLRATLDLWDQSSASELSHAAAAKLVNHLVENGGRQAFEDLVKEERVARAMVLHPSLQEFASLSPPIRYSFSLLLLETPPLPNSDSGTSTTTSAWLKKRNLPSWAFTLQQLTQLAQTQISTGIPPVISPSSARLVPGSIVTSRHVLDRILYTNLQVKSEERRLNATTFPVPFPLTGTNAQFLSLSPMHLMGVLAKSVGHAWRAVITENVGIWSYLTPVQRDLLTQLLVWSCEGSTHRLVQWMSAHFSVRDERTTSAFDRMIHAIKQTEINLEDWEWQVEEWLQFRPPNLDTTLILACDMSSSRAPIGTSWVQPLSEAATTLASSGITVCVLADDRSVPQNSNSVSLKWPPTSLLIFLDYLTNALANKAFPSFDRLFEGAKRDVIAQQLDLDNKGSIATALQIARRTVDIAAMDASDRPLQLTDIEQARKIR